MTSKTVGIIIVGDEILKGQMHDTNSYFLCKQLRAIGTKVNKISVVPDDIDEIGITVKEFAQRYDIVVTSGGIGPTHDDVTYRGVAMGFDEDIYLNKELETYYSKLEQSEKGVCTMSMVPISAKIVWANTDKALFSYNKGLDVTTFPVVRVCNVFVLPGVPIYFELLVKVLKKEYFKSQGVSFYTSKVNLSVGEDLFLDALNKTVEEFGDCVFGSYPVVGNSKYNTFVTIEAGTVDRVRVAEDFFKSLIPPQWVVNPTNDMSSPVFKFRQITADATLADTLDKSIKVVEKAFDEYLQDEVMVSFNGGKDCTVLLHLVLAVKEQKGLSAPLQAVYFQASKPFPQVEKFINDTVDRYKVKLTVVSGEIKRGLDLLVRQKPNLKAIFLGTRRTDPYSQDLKKHQMTDAGWPKVMRINPILDWNYQNIWTFLRGIAVSYCPLYDQGCTSLGNQDNTRPNPCLLRTEPDGSQTYTPAWMLTDDTVERHGRL